MTPADPEVDEGLAPELEDGQVIDEETVLRMAGSQPAPDEPTAEDAQPEPTVRKEKQAAETQAKQTDPKRINLDEIEDFRRYKSERDRRESDMQKRMRELEQRAAQREAELQQQRLAEMQAALQESTDDGERQAIIEDMAALRSRSYVEAERQWARHVAQRAQEEGVDPNTFDPLAYRGQEGGMQFERDLANAAKEQLRKQLEEARKAASPETIQKTIQAEVLKALRGRGVDATVETSAPRGGGNDADDLARDIRLLNMGRLPRGEFRKRWGSVS